MRTESWKQEAFRDQQSVARDFPDAAPPTFTYAICCGHRTGSNLLGEALYKTGLSGDPMEYHNARFLKVYADERKLDLDEFDFARYMDEMRRRRTSPNGVFGINIKFEALQTCYQDDWQQAIRLIKDCDYVLFLYRKDRLRQAISLYIAQCRDLYNVPSEVSDDEIEFRVESVPFDPQRIAQCLDVSLTMEKDWLEFFRENDITYEPLAYEDLIENYEEVIDIFLRIFRVPEKDRHIPEKPMKKVANEKNEELRRLFIDFIGRSGEFSA